MLFWIGPDGLCLPSYPLHSGEGLDVVTLQGPLGCLPQAHLTALGSLAGPSPASGEGKGRGCWALRVLAQPASLSVGGWEA